MPRSRLFRSAAALVVSVGLASSLSACAQQGGPFGPQGPLGDVGLKQGLGAVLGAAGGGVIGNSIGKSLDSADKAAASAKMTKTGAEPRGPAPFRTRFLPEFMPSPDRPNCTSPQSL